MEFLAGMIGFIIVEIVLAALGWVCLFVWYRNRKKMEEIKNKEYAGEYSAAGKVFILNFIAGAGAISMFGMVIFFLVVFAYRAITN
ncbi:MAG TPA: hypothetical protein VGK59_22870 [Ohtaekwangia sp.]